jgi:hypothetical protein
MPTKPALATLRAASLTLTSSFAPIVGTVSTDAADSTTGAVKLGGASRLRVQLTYTRHASSTTGRPKVRAMLSADPPTTAPASVAHWFPAQVRADAASTAGVLDVAPEVILCGPSASGASSFALPTIDVSLAHWIRFEVTDQDTTNLGAVSAVAFMAAP